MFLGPIFIQLSSAVVLKLHSSLVYICSFAICETVPYFAFISRDGWGEVGMAGMGRVGWR